MRVRITRSIGSLAAGLAVAALVASCSDTVDSPTATDTSGRCTDSRDCPRTQGCSLGLCVTAVDVEVSVSLRFIPPSERDDLVSQTVADVPVRLGHPFPAFAFGEPARITGRVTFGDGVDAFPAPSDIIIRSDGEIPGRARRVELSTAESGAFSVDLPPGRYDLSILPRVEGVAPLTVDNFAVGEADQFRSFALPSPASFRRIRGRVVRVDPAISRRVPIPGARVVALADDGAVRSSSALTSDEGVFNIFIAPSDALFVVQVAASSENTLVPPTYVDEQAFPSNVDIGDIVVGSWSEPASVEGRVVDQRGEGVSSLLVPFLLGSEGERRRLDPILTEDDGRFGATLIPGTFDFFVAPTSHGFAATIADDVEVSEQEGSSAPQQLRFLVQPAREISGFLVAPPQGSIVPNALVVARPVSVLGLTTRELGVASNALEIAATTDRLGRFSLPLSDGRYRISYTPQRAIGLAGSRTELEVERASEDLTLRLRSAGAVQTRILDPAGAPLPGSRLEAFQIRPGGAELLATGVADRDGIVTILIPAF